MGVLYGPIIMINNILLLLELNPYCFFLMNLKL